MLVKPKAKMVGCGENGNAAVHLCSVFGGFLDVLGQIGCIKYVGETVLRASV